VKKRLPIIAAVLCALVGGGYLIDRSRNAQESLLSGYFENQPTQASSRLGGRVTRIFVKEGDTVKPGQPLVAFEDAGFTDTVAAQREALEQARQQDLEAARGTRPEEIERQKAAVKEAQADYEKLLNGPLPEEIRSARDKVREARANYDKLVAGSRPEDIAAARAADRLAYDKLREAQNGLTAEERNELAARLAEAVSGENLDQRKYARMQSLFDQDAVAAQDLDVARAAYEQATGQRKDAQEALKRAEEGTRPEEIAQARDAYRQAHAQLQVLLDGSRTEDVETAREEMRANAEALNLELRGSRQEDVAAGRDRLEQAKASLLELENGNRREDVAKAKAAQQQAAEELKSSQTNLRERMVLAPISAAVDRVLIADGDLVAANSPVIQLSDPADIWVRVYVPEKDLSKIRVGDLATLTVDGVSGDVTAKVESIATQGAFTPANLQSPEDRGLQVFGVRLRLAAPDARVKAGMYATVKKVGHWQ
jgi:multidrug resistance efflux pump